MLVPRPDMEAEPKKASVLRHTLSNICPGEKTRYQRQTPRRPAAQPHVSIRNSVAMPEDFYPVMKHLVSSSSTPQLHSICPSQDLANPRESTESLTSSSSAYEGTSSERTNLKGEVRKQFHQTQRVALLPKSESNHYLMGTCSTLPSNFHSKTSVNFHRPQPKCTSLVETDETPPLNAASNLTPPERPPRVPKKTPIKEDKELVSAAMHNMTPLHLAASNGDLDIVLIMLSQGNVATTSLEAKNRDGHSPLALAALNGHIDVVDALLGAGSQIESRDIMNRTPLMLAAQCGQENICHFLLVRDANPLSKDNDGKVAANLAEEAGHKSLAVALKTACLLKQDSESLLGKQLRQQRSAKSVLQSTTAPEEVVAISRRRRLQQQQNKHSPGSCKRLDGKSSPNRNVSVNDEIDLSAKTGIHPIPKHSNPIEILNHTSIPVNISQNSTAKELNSLPEDLTYTLNSNIGAESSSEQSSNESVIYTSNPKIIRKHSMTKQSETSFEQEESNSEPVVVELPIDTCITMLNNSNTAISPLPKPSDTEYVRRIRFPNESPRVVSRVAPLKRESSLDGNFTEISQSSRDASQINLLYRNKVVEMEAEIIRLSTRLEEEIKIRRQSDQEIIELQKRLSNEDELPPQKQNSEIQTLDIEVDNVINNADKQDDLLNTHTIVIRDTPSTSSDLSSPTYSSSEVGNSPRIYLPAHVLHHPDSNLLTTSPVTANPSLPKPNPSSDTSSQISSGYSSSQTLGLDSASIQRLWDALNAVSTRLQRVETENLNLKERLEVLETCQKGQQGITNNDLII